jgi:hypothetical protein
MSIRLLFSMSIAVNIRLKIKKSLKSKWLVIDFQRIILKIVKLVFYDE